MPISWSFDPLLKATLPRTEIVSLLEDIDLFRKIFLVAIIMSILYPAFHRLLMHFKNYRQIDSASKQVVVLHHAIEAIILTTSTPVFTYFMVKTNFVSDNGNLYADISTLIVLGMIFIVMYLYEMASRFQTPRSMLVVHHLLAISDMFLLFVFPTTTIFKTGVILSYAICFEALTFTGLFMYRMAPLNKFTPKIIFSGLVVFGVTRPIQVLWIFAAALGSWNDPNTVKWQALMQISFTVVMTGIQFWSLTINYTIWKRAVKRFAGGKIQSQETMPIDKSTSHDEERGETPMKEEEEDDEDISDWFDDSSTVSDGFASFVQFLKSPHENDNGGGIEATKDEKVTALKEKKPKSSGLSLFLSASFVCTLVVALYTVVVVQF